MDAVTLLGSPFEMSLRILLMLDEITDAELDEQQICSIDFIAVYAADFGLLDENLHGYGSYRFGEYPARKRLVSAALKDLVLNGNVVFSPSRKGFIYRISDTGRKVSRAFTSSYACEYRIAVHAVACSYDIANDISMLKDINRHTLSSLQEGTDE